MIDLELVLGVFILSIGIISLLSLVVWWVILFVYLEEIDGYFDSPDFPNRGYKGVWPWGMGRGMAYGVFLLFPGSRFVKKKFPRALEEIDVEVLPKRIKLLVAFPMYTYIPAISFLLVGGVFLKMKDWFL
ncbi:hypothetical protein [Halomonas koreensis]|uniref:Uncharacterized protein n=1 Tax=Halomonas koreensis TaxID=245385 RepID=A0ABU1G889_9GAMM|nr:hypothetical protein [Halomonas koreensis]MDR5868722.1 hypothetical protein [Halomonas koreensis]